MGIEDRCIRLLEARNSYLKRNVPQGRSPVLKRSAPRSPSGSGHRSLNEAIHHEAFYEAQHVVVGPEAKLIGWDDVSHIIQKRKRKIESPWIKEGGKAASKKASYDRCVWKRYKPVDSVFCKKENGAQRGAIRRGKFNVTMPRGPEYPGLSILHANGDAVIAENSAAGQTCQKPRDGALACAGLTDKQVAIASIIDDAACVQVCACPRERSLTKRSSSSG